MGDRRFEFDKLIHKGRVAELHSVGVRMPDGTVVQRDYVHYGGAAVVLPILEDGSVVMIRNYRFAVEEHLLELPAGMMDGDEEPRAAAARELAEETGYTAGRIEPLGEFYTGPGTTDERMYAFLATELTKGRQNLEQHEQIQVEVHAADEVRRMVADGAIHDGKTIAALGLYWLRTRTV
ncbi:MAG TPA: NUDIX hydrolase [Phycisphaerae bacterium]|nr:NUDIX hydrolase [Phycisphaerae bacterium]